MTVTVCYTKCYFESMTVLPQSTIYENGYSKPALSHHTPQVLATIGASVLKVFWISDTLYLAAVSMTDTRSVPLALD